MMCTSHKRAFTMIETFVAISVLLITLAGPLSLAAQALKSAYYARDEITAFYLAQEGLEYIRAVRDQNYLATPAPRPWLTGIDQCINKNCNVDFPHFTSAVVTTPTPLLIDGTSSLYNTSSGTPSPFTRNVTITSVSTTEIIVKVQVSWISSGISRTFILSEHLFDWL